MDIKKDPYSKNGGVTFVYTRVVPPFSLKNHDDPLIVKLVFSKLPLVLFGSDNKQIS